jgi:MFS family permease
MGAAAAILVACICGWLVMQLEILGGRVLIPYFGSAVYVVMGSVIGVFLLSLSGGYLLGGWLSNRRRSREALGVSLLAAGVWLCALPAFIEPVCGRIVDMGMDDKWGSLTAAFLLFAVPTVLLGTVSPTVVRWLTKRASDSGLNAGLVLAFSTLASFGGCVVTAFYLVLFSVRATITVSGVALLVLGGTVLLSGLLPSRGGGPEGGRRWLG